MEELTCDECGTINDADREVCELCGDPLGEEREEAERKSLLKLVAVAIGVSALTYGLGAVVMVFVIGYASIGDGSTGSSALAWLFEMGTGKLLAFYTVIWGLGVVTAPMYSPKDNYYFGYANGLVDDPFTYRDDMDRTHATAGCLAMPFMLVYGLWKKVFERLSGDDETRR